MASVRHHPEDRKAVSDSRKRPLNGTDASIASDHPDRGDDRFTWDLRRVGHTLAWSLDVTVLLRTANAEAVGPTLSDLTNVLREQGLIPVTTERFS